MARVEFMAVREDAEALIAKGHPAMSIYQQFKAAGKISMSYRAFHRHLKGAPKKARQSAPPEMLHMLQITYINHAYIQEISVAPYSY